MGKASMCLKMLELLNTGQVYKCSELATLLETNSRNIIEYKKELEEAGYYITSIPGKYGGYQLEKTILMPSLKLTEKEKNALAAGSIYLSRRSEFPYEADYQMTIAKIFSTISHKRLDDDYLVVNEHLQMPSAEIETRYKSVINAVKNRYILKINYLTDKNKEIFIVFHPYELFMLDNMWYVIGWNELTNDIDYCKINRMIQLEETTSKFNKWKYYNRSNYLDEYGIKNEGSWLHLELKVSGRALVAFKEKLYGKNQMIKPLNKTSAIVSLDMQNKDKILSFILGFGKDIEIIEPKTLQKDMVNIIESIKKIYE